MDHLRALSLGNIDCSIVIGAYLVCTGDDRQWERFVDQGVMHMYCLDCPIYDIATNPVNNTSLKTYMS